MFVNIKRLFIIFLVLWATLFVYIIALYFNITNQRIMFEKQITKLNTRIVELETQPNSVENITEYVTINMFKERATDDLFVVYDIPLTEKEQRFIYERCQEHELHYELVLGLIHLETGGLFDSTLIATNSNGTQDMGLMQINSAYAHWYAEIAGLKEYDVFNFEDSVRMGTAGLAYWRDLCISKGITENLEIWMLNSYNMGFSGYSKVAPKNRAYDRIILQNMIALEAIESSRE